MGLATANYNKLPLPLYENYEWQEKSACRGMDSGVFYLEDNARGAKKAKLIQEAKKICATCEVREQCLEYALEIQEPYGVWGGMSEEERRYILIRRGK